MDKIRLAKRIVKIAKALAAASGPFDENKYDDLRKKSEDELVDMLKKYVANLSTYADEIKKKNIGRVIALQAQVSALETKYEQGKKSFDEYNKEMSELTKKIERKQAYARGEFPKALDTKNYTDVEYKFVDSVMRQGGSIRETLAALAFIKTQNERIVNLSNKFCEYLTGLLASDGVKLRATLSKQSGNRNPYRAMLQSVPNRTRMKLACQNAENCTREIAADLVNAEGRVIAHISFLNQMQQRVSDKGKQLDKLNFENEKGVMASAKTAGLLDTIKEWVADAGKFFGDILNKFTEFCKDAFDAVKKLFGTANKYKGISEQDAIEVEREFEQIKKVLGI